MLDYYLYVLYGSRIVPHKETATLKFTGMSYAGHARSGLQVEAKEVYDRGKS